MLDGGGVFEVAFGAVVEVVAPVIEVGVEFDEARVADADAVGEDFVVVVEEVDEVPDAAGDVEPPAGDEVFFNEGVADLGAEDEVDHTSHDVLEFGVTRGGGVGEGVVGDEAAEAVSEEDLGAVLFEFGLDVLAGL